MDWRIWVSVWISVAFGAAIATFLFQTFNSINW